VIHHGVDSSLFENVFGNIEVSKKSYLLYVGTRTGYKNIKNFFLKKCASKTHEIYSKLTKKPKI